MNIRTLNTGELNLLFQLFDYNDPDEMIAENTVDINERKIDIFGLFQEDRLIERYAPLMSITMKGMP
ncbi:MAG: hypothetical protein ACLTZI_03410 [[Eubacterium] siraeum]